MYEYSWCKPTSTDSLAWAHPVSIDVGIRASRFVQILREGRGDRRGRDTALRL